MYKLYNSCKNKKPFPAKTKNHTFEIQPPTYVNTK